MTSSGRLKTTAASSMSARSIGPGIRRALQLAVLCVLVAGCAADQDTPLADWVGRSDIELEQAWGVPTEQNQTDSGRTVTYVSYWNRTMAGTSTCRHKFI